MATSFDEIKNRFLSKIIDYDYLGLDVHDQDQMFDTYLINAIPKFRYCRKNLRDRDMETRTFNEALSDAEQDILSSLCVAEWMGMQTESKENFEKYLTTKDFQIHSPANQLKEIRATRDSIWYRVNTQINFYRFDIKSSEV
ncbi:hypothetical protein [Heyndrickxia oleronia]|uniref:hypothetical protein n=1 Tax=Heyndrickxia oleronia TaxID=38875 RepID=UPI0024318243|nr:hypothetical protein [Heyndrickxia oleronia]MCI1763641.1 hypothetical protein [Heyndrickxia oleronia]